MQVDMTKLSGSMLVLSTVASQAIVGFLLYRQLFVSKSEIWNSAFLVFYAPVLCGVGINTVFVYGLMPKKWPIVGRFVAALISAAVVGIVAQGVCMIIAFNTYGT